MILNLHRPIPYRPNSPRLVLLFTVSREQLCKMTHNPTAYTRSDGNDAKSLKVSSSERNHNSKLFSITYDAKAKEASVWADWSLYKMNQARESFSIYIVGNHNVNIEARLTVVHPLKEPVIKLISKEANCVWGDPNACILEMEGTKDGGHEVWKYSSHTKIFIEKKDFFLIPGLKESSFEGVIGYMIEMLQWEHKSLALQFVYGDRVLNTVENRVVPVKFIYYNIDDSRRERIVKQTKEDFVINFSPMDPIIVFKFNRLQDELILGTKSADIFEIILDKQNKLARDFDNLLLTATDKRVNIISISNRKYYVSIDATSLKKLPETAIQIALKAKADNADEKIEYIYLTATEIDGCKSIVLRQQALLEINDDSEIKDNGRITLYKGNPFSRYTLNLKNISSTVLGTGLELKDIRLEISSDMSVTFDNGKTKDSIIKISDSSFASVNLRIKPEEKSSTKSLSIVITSEYSKALVVTVDVCTKDKIEPQLSFYFNQDESIHYVDTAIFNPIIYNEKRIGTLTIDAGELIGDVTKYAPYDLSENPIVIADNTKISIFSRDNKDILLPGEKTVYDVFLQGAVNIEEKFLVQTGTYNEVISLIVSPELYRLPKINFKPLKEECCFEYISDDKLYIGDLFPVFPEGLNYTDIDCTVCVNEHFCLENDTSKMSIDKCITSLRLYLLIKDAFGEVDNIKTEQTFPLMLTISSSVLCNNLSNDSYQNIVVSPIPANASPLYELQFEQTIDENNHVCVYYSEAWAYDERNQLCRFILGNGTLLHYSPNAEIENDFVEFSDIQIFDDCGIIVFENPGIVRIENGQENTSLPVYLDCQKWNGYEREITLNCNVRVRLASSNKSWTDSVKLNIELIELRNDQIYSLDFGTTGIVMAKQENYQISAVQLKDNGESKSQHIEESDNIISSITIVHNDKLTDVEYDCHQILISPRRTDYKNNAKFVFVPAKFMVGQERIPYVDRYLKDINNVAFDPKLTTIGDTCDKSFIYSFDANSDGINLTPELFLQLAYDNILNRCEDREHIKKLVLTYPNTYTQDLLDKLRVLVSTKIKGLTGFVNMIPESDAVFAYYFNERINYFGDDPIILNERRIKEGKEKILIYDMGAGTLDLSLITISRDANTKRVNADIEKKIGIPIAGNYLDWVLYYYFFRDKIKTDGEKDKVLKNLKDYIKQIKPLYTKKGLESKLPVDGAEGCLEEKYVSALRNGDSSEDTISFKDLDNSIDVYVKLCSSTILSVFLGKGGKVDRLVYSGRGSQFGPLRAAVEKYLKKMNSALIVDNTINEKDLKICVAKGALFYNDLFGADGDNTITNRNQHLNIGVVYIASSQDGGNNAIYYKELIHPDDERWPDEAILQDGTWWRNFCNTVEIDLSVRNQTVFFIQTLLDEDRIKSLYRKVYDDPNSPREDLDWVFINELFSFNTNTLSQLNRNKMEVCIKIDKENNIQYRVGGRCPRGERLVDHIENNIFYQKGMWPYVVFDN